MKLICPEQYSKKAISVRSKLSNSETIVPVFLRSLHPLIGDIKDHTDLGDKKGISKFNSNQCFLCFSVANRQAK